ncbi:DUF5753 domain-containing protein [Streptomyces sp. NPDC057654]|uniref:DUF5753 domain-containing protein n=1 Tax=Streptomyces sp. NPDC057654 TaxID=3346196 RepID=UPI0036BE7805
MAMAQDRGKGWWDSYGDVMGRPALDLAELESQSVSVRSHELLVVPGLLQTADYARAICEAADGQDEAVDRYVEFRLARQQILQRGTPATCHAVIHEAALHMRAGDPRIMRQQLRRLIEVARLPNVTVQIFPFEAGAYSAISRAFVIFGRATPDLDTVRLERPIDSAVLRDKDQADKYKRIFAKLTELALPPVDPDIRPESHEARDSLSLIQHVMHAL